MVYQGFNGSTVGETLTKIRKNKKYTQKFVSKGIIGQPTYSKIEKGVVDPTYPKMVNILKRMDISEEEFHFLMEGTAQSEREKIIQDYFLLNYNDVEALLAIRERIYDYLKKQEDFILTDIQSICNALITINQDNDYSKAKEYADKVWNRLQSFDYWYMMEIRLMNSILFIFPARSAIHIAERMVNQLNDYPMRESKILLNNIQVNLSLLLIKNQEYLAALHLLNEIAIAMKAQKNYYLLSIICIRKGIAISHLEEKSEVDFIEKGMNLVRAFEEPELEKGLQNEINTYAKKEPNE